MSIDPLVPSRTLDARDLEAPSESEGDSVDVAQDLRAINECAPYCRVCFEGPEIGDLIAPCLCTGSVRYVHVDCLARWREQGGGINAMRCEICHAEYRIERGKHRPLRACILIAIAGCSFAFAGNGAAWGLGAVVFSSDKFRTEYGITELNAAGRILLGWVALLWLIGFPLTLALVAMLVPCVGAFVFLAVPLMLVASLFSEEAWDDVVSYSIDKRLVVVNVALGSLFTFGGLTYAAVKECARTYGGGSVLEYRPRTRCGRCLQRFAVWWQGRSSQVRVR